jgi:chitinase
MTRFQWLFVALALCAFPTLAQVQDEAGSIQAVTEAATAPSYKVVGYYPQWGIYDTPSAYNVKNVVTSGSAPLLTHLIYAFAVIQDNKCVSADTWADYQDPLPADETVDGVADSGTFAGNFHQLQELKAKYPKLDILISIGGGGLDPSLFSTAAQPANRKAFVQSCIDMYIKGEFASGITKPGIFTGIDIDWEFPADTTDETNFVALLKEFRTQLGAINGSYLLTSTAPAGSWAWDYMDFGAAASSLNFLNVMNYDFDGPWSDTTGFGAPLYKTALDTDPQNNASYVIASYLAMKVPKSKLVFGMPFYGYEWTGVPKTDNGIFQPGTPSQNSYQYNQIDKLTGYTKYRDTTTQEPWLYNSKTGDFWTYDDPTVLEFKTKYVVKEGLGGVMFWELSGDTASGTLIKTLAGNL